jgi:RNA polymerase sigma-70 factor (ECF subfamily)
METKSGLIKKLASGNPAAFMDIFNLLYPRMLGYCKLFVKDYFLAEDLVQECFVQLWNKRKTLNTEGNIERLLFVMLRNHCLNFLRDHRVEYKNVEFQEKYINKLESVYQIDFMGEEENSLEEQLSVSLSEAIDNLPTRQKEVFFKTKIENLSQKDVAIELGISVKAIEKHIALAKKRIRNELLHKYPTLILFLIFIFTNKWVGF